MLTNKTCEFLILFKNIILCALFIIGIISKVFTVLWFVAFFLWIQINPTNWTANDHSWKIAHICVGKILGPSDFIFLSVRLCVCTFVCLSVPQINYRTDGPIQLRLGAGFFRKCSGSHLIIRKQQHLRVVEYSSKLASSSLSSIL